MEVIIVIMYIWAGFSVVQALEQIEEIVHAVNDMAPLLGKEPIKTYINRRWSMRLTLATLWPLIPIVWLYEKAKSCHQCGGSR